MSILERVDIPTNDYDTEKLNFSCNKYSLDYNLSDLQKTTDDINQFRSKKHHHTKVASVPSEHEPLFNSENIIDNNQQGDTIATIAKSNLWVPGKKHPQIAPEEFTNWIKQYREEEEKLEKPKTKSKLQRKKSQLSSVSYPSTTDSNNSPSTEQHTSPNTELKHRYNEKSLLRRQVVGHARKQGQRGVSVSAEKPLHEITIIPREANSQENRDQTNHYHHNYRENTGKKQSATHLDETRVPTQQKSSCIQQVPSSSSSSPRLPITDTFSKTETKSTKMIDKNMQDKGAHMSTTTRKKIWSFTDLFKKTNPSPSVTHTKHSTLSRFFSKALPNSDNNNNNNNTRHKVFLRRKRSSLLSKNKKKMPLPPSRNPFSISPTMMSESSPERLPTYVERAIYHLSHVKLANTKRPLCQQVVISNMMYWYVTTSRNQPHLPCATTMPPSSLYFEPSHYSDQFEPPRHDTEEYEEDNDEDTNNSNITPSAISKKKTKKQKKKKYKPVQNDQYNNSVAV